MAVWDLAFKYKDSKGVTTVSVKERRSEIIRILMGRKKETIPQLAHELGVCVNTIKSDVLALTVDEHYPIDTVRGKGGGVILRDFKHQHKNIFSQEQVKVLTELISVADTYQAKVLNGLLKAYA